MHANNVQNKLTDLGDRVEMKYTGGLQNLKEDFFERRGWSKRSNKNLEDSSAKVQVKGKGEVNLIEEKCSATIWPDDASLTIEGIDNDSVYMVVIFHIQGVVTSDDIVQTIWQVGSLRGIRWENRINSAVDEQTIQQSY